MSGGPFRDTLTPLIDEARRRLAELQSRRAALEVRYAAARTRLDAKTELASSPSAAVFEALREPEIPFELRSGAAKIPFIAGLIVGLLTWFQVFHDRAP